MGRLLIDEQCVFDEDSFLLARLDAANDEPLRLGVIASRCLTILLRSGGAVVRKRELMGGTWGEYGLEVTDNSLAQVVRQLRLAFEKLRYPRELIQTLPRIGYKLAEGVRVEILSVNTEPSSTPAEPALGIPTFTPPLTVPNTEQNQFAHLYGESPNEPAVTGTGLRPAVMDWKLGTALILWSVLEFLFGKMYWISVPDISPQVFTAPVKVGDVHVHLPVPDANPLSEQSMQAFVVRSRRVAENFGFSMENIHLYVLPFRQRGNQILCEGEIEKADTRCIGVQHD